MVESTASCIMAQTEIHSFSHWTYASFSGSHTYAGRELAEVYSGALLNLWEYLCTYLCAKDRENVENWEQHHLTAL